MNKRIVVFALSALLAGCTVGPQASNFRPALQPGGVEATLRLTGGNTLKGELLAVSADNLMILSEERVTRVPFASMRSGSFLQTGIRFDEATALTAADRERLRLLSRFPQGLDASLLSALLNTYGQTDVVVK